MNEHITRKLGLALQIMRAQKPDSVDLSVYQATRSCGTVACILGHCAASAKFPGLELAPGNNGVMYLRLENDHYFSFDYAVIGSRVFDIPQLDAVALFGPRYASRSRWLDYGIFDDPEKLSEHGLAIGRLEYAIERYSKSEQVVTAWRY